MYKLRFWLYRFYVNLVVLAKNLVRNPWQVVEGIYLPLTPDIGFNTLRWIIKGNYEEGEIQIIRQRIAKNDRVLEIGTGLGFVSAYCAKIVGSTNVYSYEANPLNIEIAKKVYAKNNVQPNLTNALLSTGDGFVDFRVDRSSRLASSIFSASGETVKVAQLDLNETIAAIKPDFLIMDIEGAEYDVFKIIQFQTIQKIQVEIHPSIIGDEKVNEIFTLLNDNGFAADIIMPDGRNYFFTRKTS